MPARVARAAGLDRLNTWRFAACHGRLYSLAQGYAYPRYCPLLPAVAQQTPTRAGFAACLVPGALPAFAFGGSPSGLGRRILAVAIAVPDVEQLC